jgi:Na+(H+)/acetate symporter ActP
MLTIKFISLCWALFMSFYFLVAKFTGVSPLVGLIFKALSLISLIYFELELIKLFP